MIYVCSVYSLNKDNIGVEEHKALMHERYEFVRDWTAHKLKEGFCLFAPIAHCHDMSLNNDMPRGWDFWGPLDMMYIDACDQLWVLEMPGWEDSVGITAEIKYAKEIGMDIAYIPVMGKTA